MSVEKKNLNEEQQKIDKAFSEAVEKGNLKEVKKCLLSGVSEEYLKEAKDIPLGKMIGLQNAKTFNQRSLLRSFSAISAYVSDYSFDTELDKKNPKLARDIRVTLDKGEENFEIRQFQISGKITDFVKKRFLESLLSSDIKLLESFDKNVGLGLIYSGMESEEQNIFNSVAIKALKDNDKKLLNVIFGNSPSIEKTSSTIKYEDMIDKSLIDNFIINCLKSGDLDRLSLLNIIGFKNAAEFMLDDTKDSIIENYNNLSSDKKSSTQEVLKRLFGFDYGQEVLMKSPRTSEDGLFFNPLHEEPEEQQKLQEQQSIIAGLEKDVVSSLKELGKSLDGLGELEKTILKERKIEEIKTKYSSLRKDIVEQIKDEIDKGIDQDVIAALTKRLEEENAKERYELAKEEGIIPSMNLEEVIEEKSGKMKAVKSEQSKNRQDSEKEKVPEITQYNHFDLTVKDKVRSKVEEELGTILGNDPKKQEKTQDEIEKEGRSDFSEELGKESKKTSTPPSLAEKYQPGSLSFAGKFDTLTKSSIRNIEKILARKDVDENNGEKGR